MFTGNGDKDCLQHQELSAILAGLHGCEILEERRIILNSDSMRAVNIAKGLEDPPWYLIALPTK